ncbi:cell division protein FtsQ/DivIB [Calidithermus timidus]|uniref:cell division protein FtsQ/DivIB n=1 Tax=Calidithermus timidus TaxID=307124 RepID=UPI000376F925|nr:FtsQ-type POTRA domain-containing protein [Calidithermus timidus]
MIRSLLALLTLATLGIGSRVVWPVERVEVVGNIQLSDSQVRAITGLEVGTPWLWAWPKRLEALRANPWVRSARLERPAIGQLRIVLEERKALATLVLGGMEWGLSDDGTLLPNPPETPIRVEGLGSIRLSDVIAIVKALPNATSIRYTPAGYTVRGKGFEVWAATATELQKWASERKSLANKPTYLYPWGESKSR